MISPAQKEKQDDCIVEGFDWDGCFKLYKSMKTKQTCAAITEDITAIMA